jgi:hypothetical protein
MIALEDILEICDERHLQILAVWTPRESNELADYLSHLSHRMFRSNVGGVVGENNGLKIAGTTGRASEIEEERD